SARDVRWRRAAAEELLPLAHFALFLIDENGKLVGRDADLGDDAWVEVLLASLGDRAEPELRPHGRADLAHDPNVEIGAELARDLGRDDDAAARQADHERSRVPVFSQVLGELAP